ncbi:cytoplasmic protein NCK2 [Lingula anatina]|uniref:Cytoplasmic protein NCK2 n=1 Tax=Lingula anatina TaxID=7574 RepID=A0A1S3KB20_LINAN|nr:cytoplasmic protein NCK2 [Lingula anatina]XP_013419625.1 cytoplasmic protein NCK2 [Lingula anatina]XP_013419626.1 cytoplasmic protein NCK2 [Lingula anatina]XP_013419628.1 cytoplasmic protein NCK2 [Lingula anatina]XP_013419629.1 cytoplasmic protein NCK2 [Lingula anatina]|eukprot:XP_013419624.1 cytoplasmic protein NCK2 [Lingula anatina]
MKPKMAEEVMVIAKYDYQAQDGQELDIKKNEKLILLDDSKTWWKVQNARNQAGFVPSNYVKRIKPSIFSSLKNTLGRKKNSDSKALSYTSSPSATVKASHSDTSEQGSIGSETQFCDNIPAIVKYAYPSRQSDEMSLVKGEKVIVLEKSSDGWWKGRKMTGETGWFPSNYVIETEDPDISVYTTPADMSSENTSQTVLDVVITLYQYKGTSSDELTFDKEERLEIIERPQNDPEWWRARNARGDIGLVPKNYVQVITNSTFDSQQPNGTTMSLEESHASSSSATDSAESDYRRSHFNVSGPLVDKEWFYGRISRHACDDLLNEHAQNGDFVIRESESNVGDYTVTLKAPNRNKHFRVQMKDNMFCIGTQQFQSLDDLVEHYKRHPIYRHDNEKLYLVRSFVYTGQ